MQEPRVPAEASKRSAEQGSITFPPESFKHGRDDPPAAVLHQVMPPFMTMSLSGRERACRIFEYGCLRRQHPAVLEYFTLAGFLLSSFANVGQEHVNDGAPAAALL